MSLEEGALDQFVQEAPETAALDPDAVHDAGDVVAVAERHVAAGRIAGQLLRKVLEQVDGIRSEQRLELGDAGEGAAVGQRAGSVDLGPQLEADPDERVDRAARGVVAGSNRAVARPLAAKGFGVPASSAAA